MHEFLRRESMWCRFPAWARNCLFSVPFEDHGYLCASSGVFGCCFVAVFTLKDPNSYRPLHCRESPKRISAY